MGTSSRRERALAPLAITLAAVVIALAVVVLDVFSREEAWRPTSIEAASMNTVVIPVEGMSCVACAARVKKTLTSIAGVGDTEVSLGERNARVRFDPSRIDPHRLVATINALGYRAGTPAVVK